MTGQTIGQYQIHEQLGSGGMGVVYRATDSKLDREVALKFLPPHMNADESAKARFSQEARAASALDHANICTIHDIDQDESGRMFIVMTFYDGETLKYRLQRGALPLSEAVDLGVQLARGLARAHEAGIVHRDVKPANIMVTKRGEVKILDFGVAKLSQSADLTKAGSTVGTAAYMSPEQSKGEQVDVRSDVWSAGVLLYEMLTGVPPFSGGYEAALTYAIINETPTSPADINPAIPREVSDVVMKCLAKDREQRFADAAHIAARLDEFKSPSGTRAATTIRPVASISEPTMPSMGAVLARFAPVAFGVLAIAWAATEVIGLPDWVLPLALMAMLMGIPALAGGVVLDKRRAEGRDIGGPFDWLSLKTAQLGGVYSISGLVLITVAFMSMRAAGIGPFGSLQASGALEENAIILVSDFENGTSEQGLSEGVTELLRIALSRSDAISLMESSDMSSALVRMERGPDTVIDVDTGMEIAQREGAEGVVSGRINPIGSGYVLSASMFAVHDGSELVRLSETARTADDIIDAVNRLSEDMRERIGESIRDIRSNEDLDRVTTGSLEALRLYSQGVKAENRGDDEEAIRLLDEAIAEDSLFAMAYRKISVVLSNNFGSRDRAVRASTRAYELRDRLPERERLITTAYYFHSVVNRPEETEAAYRSLIDRYPNETTGLNNIAIGLRDRGAYEEAIPFLERALELGNAPVYYNNMLASLSGAKQWDRVDSVLAAYKAEWPRLANVYWWEAELTLGRKDYRRADSLYRNLPEWVRNESQGIAIWGPGTNAAFQGQIETAMGHLEDERQHRMRIHQQDRVYDASIVQSMIQSRIVGDDEAALAILHETLELAPIDSLAIIDRPYANLSLAFSEAGDIESARYWLEEFNRLVPENAKRGNYAWRPAQAALLAADGRYDEALAEFTMLRTEQGQKLAGIEFEAELRAVSGDVEGALEAYKLLQDDSAMQSVIGRVTERPLAWLEMGELYSRTGQVDEAIEAYSNFVDMWIDADQELQPRVRYARNRIERLLDQSLREPE